MGCEAVTDLVLVCDQGSL